MVFEGKNAVVYGGEESRGRSGRRGSGVMLTYSASSRSLLGRVTTLAVATTGTVINLTSGTVVD